MRVHEEKFIRSKNIEQQNNYEKYREFYEKVEFLFECCQIIGVVSTTIVFLVAFYHKLGSFTANVLFLILLVVTIIVRSFSPEGRITIIAELIAKKYGYNYFEINKVYNKYYYSELLERVRTIEKTSVACMRTYKAKYYSDSNCNEDISYIRIILDKENENGISSKIPFSLSHV